MSYYRRDDDDDTEISYEDQLRVVACSNPTLIGDELISLHGVVRATTEQEVRHVRALQRWRERAAVPQ